MQTFRRLKDISGPIAFHPPLIVVVQQEGKLSGCGAFYNQFLQTAVADERFVDATPDYTERFRFETAVDFA